MSGNGIGPADTSYDGASYWSRRLQDNWTLKGVGYLGYSERYNRYLYQSKARAMRKLMVSAQLDLRDRNVLDLGSGVGFWLRWHLRHGAARVAGIDIAQSAVDRLQQEIPEADVRLGDLAEAWPFEEQFDVISAFDVLYHIVDDGAFSRAIAQAASRLHPGGWLLLTDQLGDKDEIPAPHVHFRRAAAYRDLLSREGCDICHVIPVYRLMNGGIANRSAFSWAERLQWGATRVENILAPLLYQLDVLPLVPPNLYLLAARKADT